MSSPFPFRHITPIQIRFSDVDVIGHINNARHFTYMELARVTYFNDVFGWTIDWKKEGFIVAKATVDYRKPIYMKDKLYIYSKCGRFGTKSFDLEHRFVRRKEDGTEEEVATGSTVQVAFDYVKNESIPVPQEWKRKIEAFEKI